MSGIYIHIPFCDTKCIYCDFYSITNHSRKKELIECLVKEIESKSVDLREKQFDTIFFGGGTPSLLSYDDFGKLFDTLYSNLNISINPGRTHKRLDHGDRAESWRTHKGFDYESNDVEMTIEANPGTMNESKLRDFKKLPINRLSFGVQSFIDSELKFLTRIHSSEEAIRSVKSAQDAGFDNINIDLIFALPGQSRADWKSNLEKAVSLNTQHISAYSLIFEEGTFLNELLKQGKVDFADEDTGREIYDLTMEFLPKHGFSQYEVSNYAKPGYECRHNLKYWTHNEYIGFGPSAASFIDNYRRVNVRDISSYINRVQSNDTTHDFIEYIDPDTSVYEHIFLGLRSSGIDLNSFRNKYNFGFEEKYKDVVKILIENRLALYEDSKFRLTSKGYALCDEILASYF
jgi:oxygen-independent coproporphyrinogen-3 oxidase